MKGVDNHNNSFIKMRIIIASYLLEFPKKAFSPNTSPILISLAIFKFGY